MAEDEGEEKERMKALIGKKLDGWLVEDLLGSGANGAVYKVSKNGQDGVMKIPLKGKEELVFERRVMQRIQDASNPEVRNYHLVRLLEHGKANLPDIKNFPIPTSEIFYVVMEFTPDNPVDLTRTEDPSGSICEMGNQLLKALFDLHSAGYLHRDIKPENMGLHNKKLVVLYDLGMCRRYLEEDGRQRMPRSYVGMRGTEEWASLWAEQGREQGRVDDMFAWLYMLNEWVNCGSPVPQAWSFAPDDPACRFLLKTPWFPARMVLENCPTSFYRIKLYLHTLGRDDAPDYFFLAQLVNETRKSVKRRNKAAPVSTNEFLDEIKFAQLQFL